MSFFDDREITSFLSNKSTPKKVFSKNINNINTSKIPNLFTPINTCKKIKNIFSINKNNFSNTGIFSFPKNEVNYNNISDKIFFKSSNYNNEKNKNQNTFNNENHCHICNYDSTIGIMFSGKQVKANNENNILMSISSLPEFSHGSYEEFRMADLEKRKTGNLIHFKIKNTSLNNNLNTGKNNNLFHNNIFSENFGNDNILFNKNKLLENSGKNNNLFNNIFKEDSGKNDNNIFNQKLESNIFKFNNNIYKEKNDSLFTSNKVENCLTNNITFAKKYNSPFSYISNNNNNNNKENYIFRNNNLFKDYNFNDKKTLNNNNSNTNNIDLNNSFDNLDINSILSKKGNLSKEFYEAIIKGKTVKEFLEELLYKEYKKSENKYENNLCFSQSQNNSVISDLYGSSFLSNNSNGISSFQKNNNNNNYENENIKNISGIDLRNSFSSFNEVQNFNMEIDNDINYNKLSSKLNNIYGIYEKKNNNKYLTNNKRKFSNYNNNNYKLNLNPSKNDIINENELYFNKTFTNGFHYRNSLLNDSLSNSNKRCIKNNSNVFVGRDELLYQKNLNDLNKLSISNINLNHINENKTSMIDNNQIFSVNNNNNDEKIKENKINQNIDLTIKYHLINEEDNKNKDILFYNIELPNINRLIKVKDLKEKIRKKVYDELKNKNINNYKIQKITLLTPFEFLSDDNNLIDYKLNIFNNTIQAYIYYEKIIIKQNQIECKNNGLAPIELIPKLTKVGYRCIPSIYELCRKTCEELKKVENFKIWNQFGEIEFKEPINLLGIDLDKEVTIEEYMMNTGEKLNYWSIFKLYNFKIEENEVEKYINKIKNLGGKFISYNNKELIWEYRGENGLSN